MPRHIIKLEHGGATYYTEWSTASDAPVYKGMGLEHFTQQYASNYGKLALAGLPERLARADTKGTSSTDPTETLESLVRFNRAGPDESSLTLEELKAKFCKPWKKTDGLDEF